MENEVKDREQCQLDLCDEKQVIQHIRDLINFHNLLDFDAELLKFIKLLRKEGWSKEYISRFITVAGFGTRYENDLPRPLRNRGDRKEYFRNKFRRF